MRIYFKWLVLTLMFFLVKNFIEFLIAYCLYNFLPKFILLALPISYLIFLIIVIFSFKRIFKSHLIAKIEGFSIRDLVFLLIIAVSIMVSQDPFINLFEILGQKQLPEFANNSTSNSLSHQLLDLVTTVLLVPIIEELFFRGMILKDFLNRNLSSFWAVLYSSILFSIMHFNPFLMETSIPVVLGSFLFGLVAGVVFVLRKKLIEVVFLHSAFNALSFVLNLNSDVYVSTLRHLNFEFQYWLLVLIFFIILMTSTYVYTRGNLVK